DRTARLWDAATGAELRRFEGHEHGVKSVVLSADGARVLTGSADPFRSEDRTARLWDAATGAELRRFERHEDDVTSVALSADGARVLTGSSDGTVRLWDAAEGRELARIRLPEHWGALCVASDWRSFIAARGKRWLAVDIRV
ncbi:MAG: hypothetical protein AAFV86_09010, partial [Pseudomonadota bacterium]